MTTQEDLQRLIALLQEIKTAHGDVAGLSILKSASDTVFPPVKARLG